jgi:hypothetical protein
LTASDRAKGYKVTLKVGTILREAPVPEPCCGVFTVKADFRRGQELSELGIGSVDTSAQPDDVWMTAILLNSAQ